MSSNDWGVSSSPACPTPCYLCEEIYDLHQLYTLGGVGTRLVCHDCYYRDTSEEDDQ